MQCKTDLESCAILCNIPLKKGEEERARARYQKQEKEKQTERERERSDPSGYSIGVGGETFVSMLVTH